MKMNLRYKGLYAALAMAGVCPVILGSSGPGQPQDVPSEQPMQRKKVQIGYNELDQLKYHLAACIVAAFLAWKTNPRKNLIFLLINNRNHNKQRILS
jgi:hypothetical protein